jgi:cell filamentation protein
LNFTAVPDPLCYRGTTVLRDKLHSTDQGALDEFEIAMFMVRSEEAWPAGSLDVARPCIITSSRAAVLS